MGLGKTILLVDDSDELRNTVQQLLEAKAYTVLSADSGEAALKICENTRIDILVTDLCLPSMDGASLAAAVRSYQPAVMVLMISGETPVEPKTPGDFIFLAKPFTGRTILDNIKKLQRNTENTR
jgi:two-component system cell cycle sensor histidine kinase/response regulator CckA